MAKAIIFFLLTSLSGFGQKVIIRTDSLGWKLLPEIKTWLVDCKDSIKQGQPNGRLFVQQHSGYTWSATIWLNKKTFVVSTKVTAYKKLDEPENNLQN